MRGTTAFGHSSGLLRKIAHPTNNEITDSAPNCQATNVSPALRNLTAAAALAKQHIPATPTAAVSFSRMFIPRTTFAPCLAY
ncbi:hypothetical protein GCM10007874_41210 [Labrys miyagiensis]|uniref:Uncharacterized protein n=1 Tax=Labrys miyagiensis TaxID=346912 RepID=A0ABQ6CQY3_9HYPH|nr:hypothetical protein GCM10007874_41210 [Labrys miyagiensis]